MTGDRRIHDQGAAAAEAMRTPGSPATPPIATHIAKRRRHHCCRAACRRAKRAASPSRATDLESKTDPPPTLEQHDVQELAPRYEQLRSRTAVGQDRKSPMSVHMQIHPGHGCQIPPCSSPPRPGTGNTGTTSTMEQAYCPPHNTGVTCLHGQDPAIRIWLRTKPECRGTTIYGTERAPLRFDCGDQRMQRATPTNAHLGFRQDRTARRRKTLSPVWFVDYEYVQVTRSASYPARSSEVLLRVQMDRISTLVKVAMDLLL